MLTTSTAQYLHPDYLQPLPTTLDAKKSPLALLAQTCSSIGKDTPSKPIIPPLEKKSDGKHSPLKSTPNSADDNSRPLSSEKNRSPTLDSKIKRERTAPKDIPPLVPISSKPSSKSPSLPSRSSPNDARHSPLNTSRSSSQPLSSSHEHLRGGIEHDSAPRSSVSTTQATGTVATARHIDPALGMAAGSLLHPGYYPHLFGHLPVDPAAMAGNPAYAGLSAHTLASLHAAASLKGAPASPGSAGSVSPYVAYARVKTSAGGTNLVPICRDPYCTTCQMSLHTAQLPSSNTCAAGCTEYNHQKSLYGLPTSTASGLDRLSLQSQLLTGVLPGYLPGLGLSSLYPHMTGAIPSSHQPNSPHVCNWVSGTEYCGKRFSSPEELLQHLRTHTSSTEVAQPSLAGLSGYSLPPSSLAQSPYAPPASLSPNSLRRAYPTSLSPVSAARYHPYAKPAAIPGLAGAPVPGLPIQSLGAYYSPYAALYGSRLGPAVVP